MGEQPLIPQLLRRPDGGRPSARHRIAVWDQVPRAGVIRHDVASLEAPSRAAGSATARNAAPGSKHGKIVDFRASQLAAWAV